MKYITRYEVTESLGNGGATKAVCMTLAEAKAYRGKQDLNIFKTCYGITPSGNKLRFSSEFIE